MEQGEKELLEQTYELSKENNHLLHKVRRVQKRESMFRFLRLILIIGIAFGSFYYLEPYLNKIMSIFSQISGLENKLNNVPIQEVLKKF